MQLSLVGPILFLRVGAFQTVTPHLAISSVRFLSISTRCRRFPTSSVADATCRCPSATKTRASSRKQGHPGAPRHRREDRRRSPRPGRSTPRTRRSRRVDRSRGYKRAVQPRAALEGHLGCHTQGRFGAGRKQHASRGDVWSPGSAALSSSRSSRQFSAKSKKDFSFPMDKSKKPNGASGSTLGATESRPRPPNGTGYRCRESRSDPYAIARLLSGI